MITAAISFVLPIPLLLIVFYLSFLGLPNSIFISTGKFHLKEKTKILELAWYFYVLMDIHQ